jgi:hypothetical protein
MTPAMPLIAASISTCQIVAPLDRSNHRLQRPKPLPEAAGELIGLFIAFVAIPRMVFGPVFLVIEGATFLLP